MGLILIIIFVLIAIIDSFNPFNWF
jgi:hypothetical protein